MSQINVCSLQSTQSGLFHSSSMKMREALLCILGKVDREAVHGEEVESLEKLLGVCGERNSKGCEGKKSWWAGFGWL